MLDRGAEKISESELSILSWNVEGLKNCLNDEDFLRVHHCVKSGWGI